ncbi:ras-like protein rasu-related [Anaeramoeba ignava]|uniref:Ras-like protein rasu-related n=1 Tax=Anaeramoeba ignava TaxID=1746090 RepID=A0A9Q0LMM6_ANAIG|nr:ras-like protein rasu-related [Anaeramoeba ignava]
MDNFRTPKICVCGPSFSGRKTLIIQYCQNHFVDDATDAFLHEDSIRKQIYIEPISDIFEVTYIQNFDDDFIHFENEYYRNGDIFVITVSITNFRDLEQVPLYLEKIKRYKNIDDLDSIPIILAANKIDLIQERQLTEMELKDFANQNGLFFIEISCKTRINIDECFAIRKKKKKQRKNSSKNYSNQNKNQFQTNPNFLNQIPKPKLSIIPNTYQEDLFKLLNNQQFSDVELIIIDNQKNEKQSLFLHRIILYSRNLIFKELIDKFETKSQDFNEFCQKFCLKIEKQEKQEKQEKSQSKYIIDENKIKIFVEYPFLPFYILIKYIYCGEIDENIFEDINLVKQILSISDLFKMKSLNLIMKLIIKKNGNVEEKNQENKNIIQENIQENKNILQENIQENIQDNKNIIQDILQTEIDIIANSLEKLIHSGSFSDFSIISTESNQKNQNKKENQKPNNQSSFSNIVTKK